MTQPGMARQRSSTRELASEDATQEGIAIQGALGSPGAKEPSCMDSTYKKKHLFLDLLVVVLLVIIYAAIENSDPRNVFIVYATLYTKSYPYKDNSVPSWTVPVYSIGVPLVSFIVWKLFERRRNVTWFDFYRVFMAGMFALFLTGAITNALKTAIGRPRPNFLYQCFPDGVLKWDGNNTYGGYAVCDDPAHAKEFRKSFPSGHASWSAASLGFLTFFILGQTHAFVGRARSWLFMISLVPALAAVVVGVSRITDYWHNVSDVCFGLALGFFIAFVTYLQIFPFFTSELAHVPRYVLYKQVKASRLADKDKVIGLPV